MKYAVICLLLLLAVGCARPSGVVTAPTPQPADPLAALAELPPVEWRLDRDVDLPRRPGACKVDDAQAPKLVVRTVDAAWRKHSLARSEFWAPVVTLLVCNAGAPTADRAYLTLAVQQPSLGAAGFALPKLAPGEAVGPVQVQLNTGVPAATFARWREEGERWPAWVVDVREKETVLAAIAVRRAVLGDAQAAVTAEYQPWPDLPALDLLKTTAWSQATFSPDGKAQVQVFLWHPTANYTVTDAGSCAALLGAIDADVAPWGLYLSVAGAPAAKVATLDPIDFPGGRGIEARTAPQAGTTFLLLRQYGSCNGDWYRVYAYDHATGEVYRVKFKRQDGQVVPADLTVTQLGPDGAITSTVYSNGDGLYQTDRYRWDHGNRMWVFVSETRSKTP